LPYGKRSVKRNFAIWRWNALVLSAHNCRMAKIRPKPPGNLALGRAVSEAQGEKYTQERLAEDVGLAASQIGRFVAGTREPYIMDLVRISRALKISFFDLVRPYLNEDDYRLGGSSDIDERVLSVLRSSAFQEFHKLSGIVLELDSKSTETQSPSNTADSSANSHLTRLSDQK
jgi:transcriptional regulator with XRE-family HTH domain